jgi:hypothetical protein
VGAGRPLGTTLTAQNLHLGPWASLKHYKNVFSSGRGEKNALITHCSIPLAVVDARLALAGSWEEAGAGGFGAGNTQHVDIHCVVVGEEGHCRGIAGGLRLVEGGRERTFVWCVLQLGFSFKLRYEAVGRGRCPSQKESGAEAVCLECLIGPAPISAG